MDISVVLCTYNNAERLRITLQSFCRLNQPEGLDWELVAVNNNSTDNTETVVKSFDDRLPIRYVYEPEQGLSRARNAGMDVAEGELIVFTDDDVKPNPDWLVAYWEAYQDHPEGYYFGGPIQSEFQGEPPDEDFLEAAMPSVAGLDHGPESHEEDLFVGANWACPSKHLEQTDKFDESLGLNAGGDSCNVGEEVELMRSLREKGIEGRYVRRAKLKHWVPCEKQTVEHVVERWCKVIEREYDYNNLTKVFGWPIGLYKMYVVSLLKFIIVYPTKWNHKKYLIRYKLWAKRLKLSGRGE